MKLKEHKPSERFKTFWENLEVEREYDPTPKILAFTAVSVVALVMLLHTLFPMTILPTPMNDAGSDAIWFGMP